MKPSYLDWNRTLVVGSCLMHVLCCGLPLLLSISSVAALVGVTGGELVAHHWFEAYEVPALIGSGLLLGFTAVVHGLSRFIDCRRDGVCQHAPCSEKKRRSTRVLLVTALIYTVNVALYALSHGVPAAL